MRGNTIERVMACSLTLSYSATPYARVTHDQAPLPQAKPSKTCDMTHMRIRYQKGNHDIIHVLGRSEINRGPSILDHKSSQNILTPQSDDGASSETLCKLQPAPSSPV
ncbi:hypothetical protein AG1IA_08497 [Rhizoctonia solani AG-1 IA]|uniref:Uncharacterized protein n=1 Tax=Thanatephorus cucumeris (strain AG1-IA) TaxID=983506 RepID=L8WM99_THACA|nr:hypothetical protein AG1IA_08497 [Rhizoctonia solani AG-1 IA]